MEKVKILIAVSLMFLLGSSSAFGQNKLVNNTSTDKNDLDAYRKSVYDNPPVPDGFVNDFENIFTEEENASLDSLIRDFDKKTGIEIAFISFDTSMTVVDSIEALGLKMANVWGVGQKDKNNGVIVGVSSGYGQVKILYGTGIDKLVSSKETNDIIQKHFVPYYEKDQYYEGSLAGLKALMALLQSRYKP
ncbi:MAG: hypothetical protein DI598_06180 [Pseudopedobacter saltans]|uniref:TPM domain-containing protein n=1 Tax=Pseudopedobacter saltans TaxID=151895 RepID=A0A2W5H8R2_9SPHI|nr:MAG: hypothetical protein DI598_06180 [Pseudopedobacter saltans]